MFDYRVSSNILRIIPSEVVSCHPLACKDIVTPAFCIVTPPLKWLVARVNQHATHEPIQLYCVAKFHGKSLCRDIPAINNAASFNPKSTCPNISNDMKSIAMPGYLML